MSLPIFVAVVYFMYSRHLWFLIDARQPAESWIEISDIYYFGYIIVKPFAVNRKHNKWHWRIKEWHVERLCNTLYHQLDSKEQTVQTYDLFEIQLQSSHAPQKNPTLYRFENTVGKKV